MNYICEWRCISAVSAGSWAQLEALGRPQTRPCPRGADRSSGKTQEKQNPEPKITGWQIAPRVEEWNIHRKGRKEGNGAEGWGFGEHGQEEFYRLEVCPPTPSPHWSPNLPALLSVTVFGHQVFKELVKSKWDPEGGPWFRMAGFLVGRREDGDTDAHEEVHGGDTGRWWPSPGPGGMPWRKYTQPTPWSQTPASRSTRQSISVPQATQHVGLCYGSLGKPIRRPPREGKFWAVIRREGWVSRGGEGARYKGPEAAVQPVRPEQHSGSGRTGSRGSGRWGARGSGSYSELGNRWRALNRDVRHGLTYILPEASQLLAVWLVSTYQVDQQVCRGTS